MRLCTESASVSVGAMADSCDRSRMQTCGTQVVDIISAALRALGNAKPDIARTLLELGVAVLAAGGVMPMLNAGGCQFTVLLDIILAKQPSSSP